MERIRAKRMKEKKVCIMTQRRNACNKKYKDGLIVRYICDASNSLFLYFFYLVEKKNNYKSINVSWCWKLNLNCKQMWVFSNVTSNRRIDFKQANIYWLIWLHRYVRFVVIHAGNTYARPRIYLAFLHKTIKE